MKRRKIPFLLFALFLATPALAQNAPTLPFSDGYAASGFRIAPRHLERVGDAELMLMGGSLFLPTQNYSFGIAQLGLQARVGNQVAVFTSIGPQFELGVRGRLWSTRESALGWDIAYRSDAYLANLSTFGPFNPFSPPDTIGQGLDIRLNAMQVAGGFNLYFSPVFSLLNNRTSLGAEIGVDYTQEAFTLGYALGYRGNLYTKPLPTLTLQPFELVHGAGVRYRLTDQLALQGNYQFQQNSSYNLPFHSLLAGISYRFSVAP